ncbi:MAG: DUF5931 domain-containing protein [Actinomycetota bacterium]|nr:DUF5931 domain-containing protein [Actinomycetota bacterium]
MALYRLLALVYAALLLARNADALRRPVLGVAVMAAMALWTLFTALAYRPGRRSWALLTADLIAAAAALMMTRLVDYPERIEAGAQTLPVVWVAAPVLAWAITAGPRYGAAAALVIAVAGLAERATVPPPPETVHNIVLLVLLGLIVGYAVALVRAGEERLAAALAVAAATRERERLARSIHDGVLQVLALVQRRGAEIGGETAQLGRLAGEQEVALRALVSSRLIALAPATATRGTRRTPAVPDEVDLRELLAPHARAGVSVSAPATPVLLPSAVAHEVAAAVGAALDNVARHAGEGAKAWVLVEDEPGSVVVTVRDDGVGFEPARLEEAAAQGRLGMAQSIRGRLADLGGSVAVFSTPGAGAEVEMRVPRKVPA